MTCTYKSIDNPDGKTSTNKNIKALKTRDIVTKPANRGSAKVLMDREKYIEESHKQLSNAKFY